MGPLDPDVLVGRDPAWREAWEENLDDQERRQIRRAVMRGRSLTDVELAPYVAGLIARERRRLRWKAAILTAMFSLWLFVGIASQSSGGWYFVGLGVVGLVGGTVSFVIQGSWLARAERFNLNRPRPET